MEGIENEIKPTNHEIRTQGTQQDVGKGLRFKYKDSANIDNKVHKDIDLMANCVGRSLDALPDEILEFILTYLPPYRDLECCRLVCKRWNAVVKNLVRRTKLNLHKGLLDYRLTWQVFSQQSAAKVSGRNNVGTNLTTPPTTTPIIAGRFSHSAVRHGNSMYVFGGGSSSDTTFNDLWRFDLSEMSWERPLSMGSYPSPKGSASIVCWNEQLVLFGGWRYPSLHPPYQPWCLFDELHFYDLKSNRWTLRITLSSPPPMAGHSASVHGDRMIIFGGYQIADGLNSNSNETWCLNLNELKWWQPRFMGNTKPPPRYGQFQIVLDEQHLLIMGGCGGPNSIYSDAWVLDMSQEIWVWRAIPIRNKKFGATHMWCNPACTIGSKLVVLGPTPNLPQDFQMMKQMRVPVGGFRRPGGAQGIGVGEYVAEMPAPRYGAVQQQNRNNIYERQQRLLGGGLQMAAVAPQNQPQPPQRLQQQQQRLDNAQLGGPNEQYFANRRAILQQNQPQPANNILNNNNGHSNSSNHNIQLRCGRLSELHGASNSSNLNPIGIEERNPNRPSCSKAITPSLSSISKIASSSSASIPRTNGISRNGNNSAAPSNSAVAASTSGNDANDIEAANRLQRNLALRCRDNEPLLPKRFDELYEDPFRMAAFNVQNRPRSLSKDHNERIRRMEEKMNALRNSRRNAVVGEPNKPVKEPSPKRIKRNVLSLFVCDLSAAMDKKDPHLQWIEYKNYGVIPGAPERLILSTMVAGHGELILFGGVHKETLGEITHQVSNSIHFLSAPRDII
ncbi:RING finger protein B [Eurosta solidaginis]|uniref:RING finger protein B n=1 Tax=Eurosta solidaginis TaxID=178769 RepID=UPI0035306E43